MQSHTNYLNKLLTKNNHFFVNSNNKIWDDSLFVDGIHLNGKGAKVFTEYCFKNLKK